MIDVVVIGGGPAGSSVSSYLAQAGLSVTLFEGAIHPRPHVGESLVPSTTRVFADLGFLPVMEREGFPRKYGASWHPMRQSDEFSIKFAEYPQAGVEQDYTYHVDRARFDALLLRHASELGVAVYQGAEVKEVLFDDAGRARGVRVAVAGHTIDVAARFVVDASGRRAMIGRHLKLFTKDPIFDQYATHAWFEDVERSACGTEDDIHIYFLPVSRGWVWQIPITKHITSIGVVVERAQLRRSKGEVADWFATMVAATPDIARAMRHARRINDFKQEGDYSYCLQRFTGPGYLIVGDAARFVDPIFSSGVSVALTSGKFAAEAILATLRAGAGEAEAFAAYEAKLRRGVDIWYEFITMYYRLLPMFPLFIRNAEFRLQVLQLLQGEVYDRQEVPVLAAMRRFITAVEHNDHHLMSKYLGDIDPHSVELAGPG